MKNGSNAEIVEIRLKKARRFAGALARVPFVREVYLTGSLARGKVRPTSDIDFFVHVARGRIYLTRLLATGLVWISGQYRSRENTAGKICLNWWRTTLPGARNKYFQGAVKLAQSNHQSLMEKILRGRFGNWLETKAKDYQIKRFLKDKRTHQALSHVRWSDTELGFHPPKLPKQ